MVQAAGVGVGFGNRRVPPCAGAFSGEGVDLVWSAGVAELAEEPSLLRGGAGQVGNPQVDVVEGAGRRWEPRLVGGNRVLGCGDPLNARPFGHKKKSLARCGLGG